MSTFGGIMTEYPNITLDRFSGVVNMKAKAYFLSHAHTDHMVGLHSTIFATRLKQGRQSGHHVHLYCSEVTKALLMTDSRFQHLQPYIVCLPIDQPTNITIGSENQEDESVFVTLLAAGHCPGSVMFLFEGSNGIVLYTGDFRLSKGDAANMTHLHSGSSVKDIKCIYADTTFCVPMAMHIPSREQSKDVLLNFVGSHISKSSEHFVKLLCKAKYGYEYLFVELSKAFNMKIHISSYMMTQYESLPELACHMTTDGHTTQIHACRYTNCQVEDSLNTIVVTPSTMWFTSNAQPDDILKKVGNIYRLCFSFHSSYSEICDFIGYLKPQAVRANVIPMKCTEEEIIVRLSDLLRTPDNIRSANDQERSYKPLGVLKKKTIKTNRKREKNALEEYVSLFGESHLSPKKMKLQDKKWQEKASTMKGDDYDREIVYNDVDNIDTKIRDATLRIDDDVLSETGSEKVMKYGWKHCSLTVQVVDELHSELSDSSDEGQDNYGSRNDINTFFAEWKQNSEVISKKQECNSSKRVVDWLKYLPTPIVSNTVGKSYIENNREIVAERAKTNEIILTKICEPVGETSYNARYKSEISTERIRSDIGNVMVEKTNTNISNEIDPMEQDDIGNINIVDLTSRNMSPRDMSPRDTKRSSRNNEIKHYISLNEDSGGTEEYVFPEHQPSIRETIYNPSGTDTMSHASALIQYPDTAANILCCTLTAPDNHSTGDGFNNDDPVDRQSNSNPNDDQPVGRQSNPNPNPNDDQPVGRQSNPNPNDDQPVGRQSNPNPNDDQHVGKQSNPNPNDDQPVDRQSNPNSLISQQHDDAHSDDDSTYVSGQLSQGHSEIPGTPECKALHVSCHNKTVKEIPTSRIYTMANRINLNL